MTREQGRHGEPALVAAAGLLGRLAQADERALREELLQALGGALEEQRVADLAGGRARS